MLGIESGPLPWVLDLSWFNNKSMFSLRWELFDICSLLGIPWQGFCMVPGHDCVPFNPKQWGRRTWRGRRRCWANPKPKNTREKIKGWKQARCRSGTIWCCKGKHPKSYLNNSLPPLLCYSNWLKNWSMACWTFPQSNQTALDVSLIFLSLPKTKLIISV